MLVESKYERGYQSLGTENNKGYSPDKGGKVSVEFSGRKKRNTILWFLMVGLMLVIFVGSAAYSSSIAYNNNETKQKNEALEANIQELKVQIQSTMNVSMIESKALKELGMVYPSESQIVQLGNGKNIDNFAELLREEAFK